MAFDDNFRLRRYGKGNGLALDQLDLAAAQQAGELIFRERIGHRSHGGEDDAGVGADDDRHRQGLALFRSPAAMLRGSAAMAQPAHQRGVAPRHLHPVNAEIVIILACRSRAAGYHQRPGDERSRLAGPASLNRQTMEIDIIARPHHFLARAGAHRLRFHRHHPTDEWQHVEGFAPAARRFGLAQKGQHVADLAQGFRRLPHAHGDPRDAAEQVDQHRHAVGFVFRVHDIFEQHGGSTFGEQAGLNFRDFQFGRNRRPNARQGALSFEVLHEIAQRVVSHSIPVMIHGALKRR